MRHLGKILLVDTAQREQRYYQQFIPNYNHGDKAVLASQQYIDKHFSEEISVSELAKIACTSERTLLRRFTESTKLRPSSYLQRYRIQKACSMLESSKDKVDTIAFSTGFKNVNAFRKLFHQIMGLSPTEFRRRFGTN